MQPQENDIRVLVVAEDHLARAGLAALLADLPGCTVAGQVAASEYATVAPDVFGADVALWDLGWEPHPTLEFFDRAQDTGLPAVVLVPNESYAAEVWNAGARGLLLRDVDRAVLLSALVAAAQGLAVLDPELAFSPPARGQAPPAGLAELTPREVEVVHLLAEGLPNKAIARRLDISDHTVKFHVNSILGKLSAQSRTEAVIRATRMGLITL